MNLRKWLRKYLEMNRKEFRKYVNKTVKEFMEGSKENVD